MPLPDLLPLDLNGITDQIIAEYIWIDESGLAVRSKSKTLLAPVSAVSELPRWKYSEEDDQVILYPREIYRDPFRRRPNILVLCDCYTPTGDPLPSNKRFSAEKIFRHPDVMAEAPWFGIEQQYALLRKDVNWPLGWPLGGYPQNHFNCGVGAEKACGREIADSHYNACLYAGISIGGVKGIMPALWQFHSGPNEEISAADDLWVARYILERITEMADVVLSFDPKHVQGGWNQEGAHTTFSTESMRSDGGIDAILKAIQKLSLRHNEHLAAYGLGNEGRMAGHPEEASYISNFSWSVANKGTSIRLGRDTENAGKGYFQDRRPPSNMDPYAVTSILAETTILWKS